MEGGRKEGRGEGDREFMYMYKGLNLANETKVKNPKRYIIYLHVHYFPYYFRQWPVNMLAITPSFPTKTNYSCWECILYTRLS